MIGYIYIIRNTVNNKTYIGQTRFSVEERFKSHLKLLKTNSNQLIYKAIKKYGKDKFYVETLEEISIEKLNEHERYWINKFNSCENGYNITMGGFSKVGKVLEEESICSLYVDGFSQRKIAKIYNVTHKVIASILNKYKVEIRDKNCKLIKYNKISKGNLIKQLSKQPSLTQVAKAMSVNLSAVIKAVKRFNIDITEYKKQN